MYPRDCGRIGPNPDDCYQQHLSDSVCCATAVVVWGVAYTHYAVSGVAYTLELRLHGTHHLSLVHQRPAFFAGDRTGVPDERQLFVPHVVVRMCELRASVVVRRETDTSHRLPSCNPPQRRSVDRARRFGRPDTPTVAVANDMRSIFGSPYGTRTGCPHSSRLVKGESECRFLT